MKRLLIALALSAAIAAPFFLSGEAPAAQSASVISVTPAADAKLAESAADDLKGIIDKVYPAFVMIGGGSGVCVSPDGYVVTNHHVFPDATRKYRGGGDKLIKTSVTMPNVAKPFTALPVAADPRGDIVLLKLELKEGETVPFAPLADSDLVQTGDICIAIGNPFLLGRDSNEPSVSTGVVSAVGRNQSGYSDVFQIDAAVNPGNSGGPSFNLQGEVIGINGRILTAHAGRYNTGLGYTIPSNQIKRFLPVMKAQAGGARIVRHGLVSGLAMKHDARREGCEVLDVREGSTAERAGFRPGDVVVKIEQYPIRGVSGFYGKLQTWPQGSTLGFTVIREVEGAEVPFELQARLEVPVLFNQSMPWPYPADRVFGPLLSYQADVESDFIFQSVDVSTRQQKAQGGGFMAEPAPSVVMGLNLAPEIDVPAVEKGLRVVSVGEGSASAGKLLVGDVITQIGARPLFYNHDLTDCLIGHKAGDSVMLQVRREGKVVEVEITLAGR